ncbi:MAG TPA: NUDIX hydrolase [Dyella sp.]|uniref:NUDIX hydrolase n=1 Tax=Dyella sp. TaxID=1869338 RepID=UPI002F929574
MTDSAFFSSSIWHPHVTVACVVADGDRYLMVEEKVAGRMVYNQPAGHLDQGESLVSAAVREALEETGWEVEPLHLIAVHQWVSPEHGDDVLRFSFAARAVRHHPARPLDKDIERAVWMTREEIVALGDRLRTGMVLASIDAWLAGQRLPLSALHSQLPGDPYP